MTKSQQKELRDFQYFYKLEDSRLFDKLLISAYPGMIKARNEVWKAIMPHFRKNLSQKKEVLGTILCNLKEGLLNLQTVAVSRNRNDYYLDGRYQKLHLNYFDMIAVMDALQNEGFMHSARGMNSHDNSRLNKVTRIWALKKLTPILLADPRGSAKVPAKDDELIVLKGRNNKSKLLYEDSDFTEELKRNLEEYHRFMSGIKISTHISATHPSILKAIHMAKPFLPDQFSLIPTDIEGYLRYVTGITLLLGQPRQDSIAIVKDEVTIPLRAVIYLLSHLLRRIDLEEAVSPRLKAVFNKADFLRGGRLYSGKNGWQNLSQEDRKTITFDGKSAVETDFKGMHINMLYALAGHPAPHDPYVMISGTDDAMRTIVKKMLLVSINAKNDRETVGVMQGYEAKLRDQLKSNGYLDFEESRILNLLSHWRKNCWWELLSEIKSAHAPIRKFFCSDAGGWLMSKDSRIIMEAILALIRQGIPCLPVHDSIIGPKAHQETLCRVMDETFFKFMGAHCPIEIK